MKSVAAPRAVEKWRQISVAIASREQTPYNRAPTGLRLPVRSTLELAAWPRCLNTKGVCATKYHGTG